MWRAKIVFFSTFENYRFLFLLYFRGMNPEITDLFIQGAIPPQFIADTIAGQQAASGTGAHDIFLGQVRADVIENKTVSAIEYTAYEQMANQKFHEIMESARAKYDLSGLCIRHSLGSVAVGEVCLFVMVSSAHRKAVFDGLHFVVEAIKREVPVFGKEHFADHSYQWKVNS